MSDREYIPLIDREREPESRVHEELTSTARERLSTITEPSKYHHARSALKFIMNRVGRTLVLNHLKDEDKNGEDIWRLLHFRFIEGGDTIHVLTYIEKLLFEIHNSHADSISGFDTSTMDLTGFYPAEKRKQVISDIENVLITEGILWEIEPAGEGGVIEFKPLASESMNEVDEKIRGLARTDTWKNALRGYNAAYRRYLNGDFDELIPKKLYNSIEAVLQTICVDLENWTDNRDMNHKKYLDLLNENGVYNAHGIIAPELNDLLTSLERMVSKVSDERKQRHLYHDRAYCTLLIHQVGAYLYFLINRYEAYSKNSL